VNLIDLGWNSFFEDDFQKYKASGFLAARISAVHKHACLALTENGELPAEVSGRFLFEAESNGNFPAVGDWVALSIPPNENRGIIQALLARQSCFVRKVAGETTEEQVVAANINTLFIVCGLDGNFNPRRIERYLTLAWESGAVPVVLLNKCDLCDDSDQRVDEVMALAIGVDVVALSATTGDGLESLTRFLTAGKTTAFLGSSGVGKSSIINRLLGEEKLRVCEVSGEGSRGRHTTTHRELIILPGGGLVIDTPGMRELQVWGDDRGLAQAFEDIETLAAACRFADCQHHQEPDCAVLAAIADGRLAPERFQNFLKLKKELEYLAARQTMQARTIEKQRWQKIRKLAKAIKKVRK